ncbi:DUF4928 family protein [Amaricoccus sp.]|uniref:DUF4928 family protein n=1 Tax=Amaricoccus sp. TaxID=1872485 RepID=UPI001B40F056|nr:DUF4928 family protein [Amaricoccus sp.]MBP7000232.1 DUF4928 family protein [Amaricoccus sp.]
MTQALRDALARFREAHRAFRGKGPLSVALVVTRHAVEHGLPLDPDRLLTGRGGQVLGLGFAAVQAILADHGETRVLAREAGRTSRGSIENMRSYVACLNALAAAGPVDLAAAEAFWVGEVRAFLAAKPFRLRLDPARGLRPALADLLRQAAERQRETPGMQHAGAMLQHLVGAALERSVGAGAVTHHAFSTADAALGRAGDFLVGDVAVHVTTAPGEAVIARCRDNVEAGLRAVLVTLDRRVAVAVALAENARVAERIDVLGAEQFLVAALMADGGFSAAGRRATLAGLVARYNGIIAACETDPSLSIILEYRTIS